MNMRESTKDNIKVLGGAVFVIGAIGFMGYAAGRGHANSLYNKIPNADTVQSSYVVPNKLEIKLTDLDQDGEPEVLLKYDGKPYLFRLNDKGEPAAVPYTITPRE